MVTRWQDMPSFIFREFKYLTLQGLICSLLCTVHLKLETILAGILCLLNLKVFHSIYYEERSDMQMCLQFMVISGGCSI